MCPDAELLSAWSDGEVPSPWKERIASHLEGCRNCSEKVAGFRRLSMRLQSSGLLNEASVVARVASRLGIEDIGEGLAAPSRAPAATSSAKAGHRASKRGNLALPLPFAAAAAAAILVVGLVSGRMLAIPGASPRSPLAANSAGALPANLASENSMGGSSTMDTLVRYLETQNAPVSITIQLPPNGSFAGGGTPMIVKTPPAETVSLPPSTQGLGFVMSGSGK